MILWLTGNTGSGKTTFAYKLKEIFKNVIILDGDVLRGIFGGDFTKMGRYAQNIKVAEIARLIEQENDYKSAIIVSVICPYKDLREKVKYICNCEFFHMIGGADNTDDTPYEYPVSSEVSFRITGSE